MTSRKKNKSISTSIAHSPRLEYKTSNRILRKNNKKQKSIPILITPDPRKKYKALKTALSCARKGSFTDKDDINRYLTQAQNYSEMPIAESVIKHIWNKYENNEAKREKSALESALVVARKGLYAKKDDISYYFKKAQEHSKTPLSELIIEHLFDQYKTHEPQRRKEALDSAFKFAKRGFFDDKKDIDDYLKKAQEHSKIPIQESIIKQIWTEYKKYEPKRKYNALSFALRDARKIRTDDSENIKCYLEKAQQHSSMPLSKSIVNYIWQEHKKAEIERHRIQQVLEQYD